VRLQRESGRLLQYKKVIGKAGVGQQALNREGNRGTVRCSQCQAEGQRKTVKQPDIGALRPVPQAATELEKGQFRGVPIFFQCQRLPEITPEALEFEACRFAAVARNTIRSLWCCSDG
jgi:hypothetical protein